MSTNPKLWSVDEVSAWLDTISMGQLKDKWKEKGINGEKVLALTMRELDSLGVPVMKTRAVDYQIQKLKETVASLKRDEEDKAREAIINEKISQVQQAKQEAPKPQQAQPQPQPQPLPQQQAQQAAQPNSNVQKPDQPLTQTPQPQSPAPSPQVSREVKFSLEEFYSWNTEQLSDWVTSQVFPDQQPAALSSQLKQYLLKTIMSPSALLSLEMRNVIKELNLTDIGQRRKVEHGISRVIELVREQNLAKQEREKREDVGVIKSTDKPQTLSRSLGDNITLHKEITESRVTFQVETSSDKPSLVTVTAELDNLSWNFGSMNTGSVWVLPLKGKKIEVCTLNRISEGKAWSMNFKCTQRLATLDDFVAVKDSNNLRQISAQLEVLKMNSEEIAHANPSDLAEKLHTLGLQFIDSAFPPAKKSLYIDLEELPKKIVPLQWRRPSDINPSAQWKLFGDGTAPISPNQIEQGRLGDCWFMGALSIIAARPPLVQKMFISDKKSDSGLYIVQFYREGQWKKVVVDDFIPCLPFSGFPVFDIDALKQMLTALPGQPVYGRPRDSVLWVCILEKAYAKLNQSYQALTAGTLSESLTDLTGAPSVFYYLDFYSDKESLWQKLFTAHNNGHLMGVATIQPTPEEELSGKKNPETVGLVSRHAYSLLDVRQVNGLRLLRVRNPWGKFAWTGDYSDDDNKWTNELKTAVNFVREEGTFWIPWKNFLEWFSEFTICKIGAEEPNVNSCQGIYDNTNKYGPQFELLVNTPTRLYITLHKQDLRFSVGADKDNRHGVYVLRQPVGYVPNSGMSLEFIEATGDWTRREVTLEMTLQPWPLPYIIVCSARIGNIKFREVPWNLVVQSQHPVVLRKINFNLDYLVEGLVGYMNANKDNVEVLKYSMFGLMYYAFYDENRKTLAEKGALEITQHSLEKFGGDKDLVKESLSLIWNLSCDTEVRKNLNAKGWPAIISKSKESHYKNEEVNEVADVTLRSLKLEKGMAMEPLIEKCIIADACTFSVTGKTTYLLQVWFDCYSCNLRSNFGICQTCSLKCHAGHQLSAPKFGRFFCDCGHGEAFKAKKIGVACQCVLSSEELGLQKKRAQDENYRKEDDDDDIAPHPNPHPHPHPHPHPRPGGVGPNPKNNTDKPKIATLFNT